MVKESRDARQFVVFSSGEVACGVPIDSVIEVMRVPAITQSGNSPLPGSRMFDFRGHPAILVDCRLALGFPACEHTDHSRMIVVSHAGQPLGLLVDAVVEVVSLEPGRLRQPKGIPDAGNHVTAVAHLEDGLMLEIDWASALKAALEGTPIHVPAQLRQLATTTDAA